MKNHVSCVINAHKERGYLHRAVSSALRNVDNARLLGIDCEVIIVLDNACEDTVGVADKLYRTHSDIVRLVSCEYGDLGESRNRGVLESSGEFIAFLDGDDLWGESWISGAFIKSRTFNEPCIVHPQYNVYFSKTNCHVVEHTSQDDSAFFPEFFHEQNYWTSLCFASKGIFLEHPYKTNDLTKYFGYEDWTWNYETMQHGIKHTVASDSLHYIRRGKKEQSLLDKTNLNCMPRVYPLYNSKISSSTSFKNATSPKVFSEA